VYYRTRPAVLDAYMAELRRRVAGQTVQSTGAAPRARAVK
jgi:hypothetical protein